MKKEKIKYYVKLLNEVKDDGCGIRLFVTLTFPNPSVNPIEADKSLVKLLNQLRKGSFKELYVISLMAFSRTAGIHFHIFFIDFDKESPRCKIDRWIKSDTIDADRSNQEWIHERGVWVSGLEGEIRKRWPKITKSKPNKDSVYCCGFELWSGVLTNYLARNEEKVLPREWRDMKVSWVHHWGIRNKSLKCSDSRKDEVNEQHPSAEILKIVPFDQGERPFAAQYPLKEKLLGIPVVAFEDRFSDYPCFGIPLSVPSLSSTGFLPVEFDLKKALSTPLEAK